MCFYGKESSRPRSSKLFNAIGMDKVNRIHSFSADSISKMTYEDIQYIIDNISFDYSIRLLKQTTQLCEPSSRSDRKILTHHISPVRKNPNCHILILRISAVKSIFTCQILAI